MSSVSELARAPVAAGVSPVVDLTQDDAENAVVDMTQDVENAVVDMTQDVVEEEVEVLEDEHTLVGTCEFSIVGIR